MELGKYGTLDFEKGDIIIKVKSGEIVNPKMDEMIAKVESGEIDLIKGTDFEKPIVIDLLKKVKSYLNGDSEKAPSDDEQQA